MPILQNKLVMKSIEALHDEALALTPDSASESGVAVSSPTVIVNASKSSHESSANAPAADDDDIMARIDHLLKKLDEEDDTATPFSLAMSGARASASSCSASIDFITSLFCKIGMPVHCDLTKLF